MAAKRRDARVERRSRSRASSQNAPHRRQVSGSARTDGLYSRTSSGADGGKRASQRPANGKQAAQRSADGGRQAARRPADGRQASQRPAANGAPARTGTPGYVPPVPGHPGTAGLGGPSVRSAPISPRFVAAALAALVAIVLVAVGMLRCSSGPTAASSAVDEALAASDTALDPAIAEAAAQAEAAAAQLEQAAAALASVPGSYGYSAFSASGDPSALTGSDIPEVDAAVSDFLDQGYEVSFVMYDLASGQGISRNADAEYFSASTVKAPFVTFLADSVIDEGAAQLDDTVVEDTTVAGTGVMMLDDVTEYDLATVVENTIVHSDNTGYTLLRENYSDGFGDWAAAQAPAAAGWEGETYPFYSARTLGQLWVGIDGYVSAGEGNAAWVADLLSRSSNSFIREALGDTCQVISKPGFSMDLGVSGVDTCALHDAGIVSSGSGDYLLVIMSNCPYDDVAYTQCAELVVNLATALAAVHGEGIPA